MSTVQSLVTAAGGVLALLWLSSCDAQARWIRSNNSNASVPASEPADEDAEDDPVASNMDAQVAVIHPRSRRDGAPEGTPADAGAPPVELCPRVHAYAAGATAYGFLAVEPIEDDGSRPGLAIAPNLVEHMDEIHDALPMLARAQVSLAFMLQAHKLRDAAKMNQIFELVEDAQALGITVVPVPVLSADAGYYPNATNHEVLVPVVRELVSQWTDRGLAPSTLFVDMEPPPAQGEALATLDLLTAFADHHVDRQRYASAVHAYTDLVDELHSACWKVGVTTQALLLADYDDGDDDMRQYLNVVLDGPAWDQMDFQLYRTAYSTLVSGLDSYFVYVFAKKARGLFPNTVVGVDLGLTHPGPIYPSTPTYPDSTSLRDDVKAALAAGITGEHVTIYNLKGVLKGAPKCRSASPCMPSEYTYGDNDPESWFVQVDSVEPPPLSEATHDLADQFDLLDQWLDAD